jgi:O-antigen ligase
VNATVPVRERVEEWLVEKSYEHAGASGLSGTDESFVFGKLAFASLWLLAFAIPWEDAITITGFGTSARLVGMVTLVFGVLAIIERGSIRRPAIGHMMMALFVMSAAASYLWSLYPEGTLTQTVTYVQLFALVWLIWELAPKAEQQKRLMQAYVLGTFVSGTDTVYRFFAHEESVYQRYSGAHLDANDLGLMIALSIPLSYSLLLQAKSPMTWIYRLQLALAGTTILLTASRGATLACLVALAIVPLTQMRLSLQQRVAVMLTLALLISAVIFFVPLSSWERLSTVPSEFSHGTLTGRTIIWKAGWDVFCEHPYVGIGANAFRLIVSRVLAEPIRLDNPESVAPPAHNTFLSVLVEEGIFGFAIFSAMLVALAYSLRAIPPFHQKIWLVCLGVWAVGVSSLTWEMRKPTWFFFGLLIAQCGSLAAKKTPVRARIAEFDGQETSSLHLSWS